MMDKLTNELTNIEYCLNYMLDLAKVHHKKSRIETAPLYQADVKRFNTFYKELLVTEGDSGQNIEEQNEVRPLTTANDFVSDLFLGNFTEVEPDVKKIKSRTLDMDMD